MVPCLRRGAPAGGTLHESGGNAVPCVQLHFPMPSIGHAYRRVPQRSRTGARVLPSPLLLVSEPGPAWIMPVAGTFMRRRHAARPECMAPPRIARPQPGGESRRICAAFPRTARKCVPSASGSRRDRQGPLRPHRPRTARPAGTPDRNRQVVSAHQNSPVPPCVACPGPGIEKFCFRLDGPVRVHHSTFRGVGAIAIHPSASKVGETVQRLRSAVRPKATTAPILRPGHKVGAVLPPLFGAAGRAIILVRSNSESPRLPVNCDDATRHALRARSLTCRLGAVRYAPSGSGIREMAFVRAPRHPTCIHGNPPNIAWSAVTWTVVGSPVM